MKKQSMVGLFFSMFLRATVIILAIVIVVFGVVFISKVMQKEDGKDKGPATTASPNVLTEAEGHDELLYTDPSETTEYITAADTEEEVVEEQIMSYDANILVLNSTDEIGLAGRWCETLGGFGYNNTSASDYYTPQEYTRIISTTPDLGTDLVQYFNNASYEVGTVTTGSSESTDGYDIVIIIGIADSSQ